MNLYDRPNFRVSDKRGSSDLDPFGSSSLESEAMTTLALLSIIITAAAFFGWLSVRVCRLPITIGTTLLTVISSVIMIILGRVFPGLHGWAVSLAGRIRFEDLILHGMLGPLLFAGALLLDLCRLLEAKPA